MSTGQRYRELTFAVGGFVGMLAFALGIAFLIIALSVGVREGTYLTGSQDLALGIGGVLLALAGLAVRLGRERVAEQYRRPARLGGAAAFVLGLMAALFAVSAETTTSAPFLASPREKAILFVTAFAFIIGGLIVMRAAGRAVGW